MIHGFLRSLQRTLPPLWAVVLAAFALAFWEGLYLWLRYWIGAAEAARGLLGGRDATAAGIMAAYGVFRAAAFHPLYRPKYRDWLALTPWTADKSLPLGPIHLVWQDVVLGGLLLATLHGTPLGRLWALAAFFLTYLIVLGASFWITGPWWMGYVIAAGLGLAVRLVDWPLVYLGVLVVFYAVSVVGRRMALRRFPWPESEILESLSRQFRPNSAAKRKSLLGWPFGQFAAVPPERKIRRRDGILGPLLAAWSIYAVTSHIAEPEGQKMVPFMIFSYATFPVLLGRLIAYTGPCRPPISLWGRIMTGRWIIPGYDYVLLAPLCMLLIVIVGWVAAMLFGPSPWWTVFYPLATAAVLIVALNMGPSLGRWSLTGRHRIVPWGSNDPQRVKL
jgi:hypothetical protein